MRNATTNFDVVIIGAGPAGGMCAYELSKKSLSVLVLDKEKFPRYKVCAGGLTRKAYSILPEDFLKIVENETYKVHLTLNHKWGFTKSSTSPIVKMVMRDKLDYFLIQKAIENGVKFIDETNVNSVMEFSDHVIVKTESSNFRSKVIVGADGIKGCSARFLGLRKNPIHGVAIEGEFSPQYKISDISRFNESLHLDFNVIPKGYGWIFPKKGILSIGVFTTLRRLKDLKKYLDTYLVNKGIVNGYDCVTIMGHQIPIGASKDEILSTKRGLVVGDAAGLADPITGEGIYYGLRSGQIAAEIIQRSFDRGYLGLQEYSEQINTEIIGDFRYARSLAKLLYNLSFISYNLSRKIDKLNERFLKVVTGEYTYRDMFYNIPM